MPIELLEDGQDNGRVNVRLLRRAVKNWTSDLVDRETNRRNQQAWLRAVQMLGDKWLLAKPIAKEA